MTLSSIPDVFRRVRMVERIGVTWVVSIWTTGERGWTLTPDEAHAASACTHTTISRLVEGEADA